MKYLTIKTTLLSVAIILLTGCSIKNNVPLQEAFWQNKTQRITVATIKAEKPGLHTAGQQGLLDVAITNVMNNSLIQFVKKVDLNWYNEMPHNFIDRLKQNNMLATVYPKTLNNDKKARINALAETQGDLLLTLELKAVGARREYALGFVPQGGPEGYCVLVGELMDSKNKKILWHHETEVIQKVQGKWDQPPSFPNFNAALNHAMVAAKEELLDSFFSGR